MRDQSEVPRVQTRYPFYRSGNDIIVHLHWNALHKCGRKQSGDVDWSIITKHHPSSTQEVQLQLQSVHNMMSYLTILVLESPSNVTPWHCPRSLINLPGSLYEEAQFRQGEWAQITMATEAAMHVHDTLPQGIESIHALLWKVKIFTTCTVTRVFCGKKV